MLLNSVEYQSLLDQCLLGINNPDKMFMYDGAPYVVSYWHNQLSDLNIMDHIYSFMKENVTKNPKNTVDLCFDIKEE